MATMQSEGPWGYIQPWDEQLLGEQMYDEEQRKLWTRIVFFAGTLPYIWREEARPLNSIIYGLLEARPGDRVLIIGEAIEGVGWDRDLRALVGPQGHVDAIEIINDARASALGKSTGRNGRNACWKWEYTKDMPDESYDCVAVLQSTQHNDDWMEGGAELLRVVKPGRRVVFAEASFLRLKERLRADVHIKAWYDRVMAYVGLDFDEMSMYSCDDLAAAMGHLFDGPEAMEWQGVEMFWGRKP